MGSRSLLALTAVVAIHPSVVADEWPSELLANRLDPTESYACRVIEFDPALMPVVWRLATSPDEMIARLDPDGLELGGKRVCVWEGRLLREAHAAAPLRCDRFVRVGYSDLGIGPLEMCLKAKRLDGARVTTEIAGYQAFVELPSNAGGWQFDRSESARIAEARGRAAPTLGSAEFQAFLAALDACAKADASDRCAAALLYDGPLAKHDRGQHYAGGSLAESVASGTEGNLAPRLRDCAAAYRRHHVDVADDYAEAQLDGFTHCLAIRTADGWRLAAIGGSE